MKGTTGRIFTPDELTIISNYVNGFQAGKHYEQSGSCMLWLRSKTSRGYGTVCIMLPTGKATISAHKISWLGHKMENVPADQTIDHKCRNKTCINPEHMEICTRAENNLVSNAIIMDLSTRSHCPLGHALHEPNLVLGKKTRQCRSCDSMRSAVQKATARGEHFPEDAKQRLSDAYYNQFMNGARAPLFPTSPEAWAEPYAPRITVLT